MPEVIKSVKDFKYSSGKLGTNPGGMYELDGQRYYLKFPAKKEGRTTSHGEDMARNEVLAAKLYQLAGVAVSELSLIRDSNGNLGIASKVEETFEQAGFNSVLRSDIKWPTLPGVANGLAVDAWLCNWDVVGSGYDNIGTYTNPKTGASEAFRLDTGGALIYRAQGELKGTYFGDVALEIDTLRGMNPQVPNEQSAAIFGSAAKEEIKRGVQAIANIPQNKIEELVNEYGCGGDNEKAELIRKLLARRNNLMQRFNVQAQVQQQPTAELSKQNIVPKKIGYFEWLKSQGVESSFENTYGKKNRTEAKSAYVFASAEAAYAFKDKYLNDGTLFGEVFLEKRLEKYCVPINLKAQALLKRKFQEEQAAPLTLEDCTRQMDLVKKAQHKVSKFNGAEVRKELKVTRAQFKGVPDRIGNLSEMLSNKQDKAGWNQHAATSAIDIMLAVYLASNDHLLSTQERETINKTSQSILKTNEKERFVGGLKADANFVSYIEEEYPGDNGKHKRVSLIRENADHLLNGGQRIIVDKDTPKKLETLAAQAATENSYTQPRFLPDQNGNSDTDELIIHAGGMVGHSAMRVLKKEKDASAPGGYRYFYTKIDAGGGLERVDHDTKTGAGIYTTEVTPYFKTNELANGKLAVIYDQNGNPKKMNQNEIAALWANPKEYQRHMEASLFALVAAEREIVFYKNSGKLAVAHGEPTATKAGKFDEWQFFNNKINGTRGLEVPARTQITPIQLTGNCTAYSVMLTITHLAGDKIGYDIMQSAKTYNQESATVALTQRQADIEQDIENINALSKVVNIFSLNPEQAVYQTNKTAKINFADKFEAEAFKKSLLATHQIDVTISQSNDSDSYNVELKPEQIVKIVNTAKGFKDVGLIKNLLLSQECEIRQILDGEQKQNYVIQFANQDAAKQFSTLLNEKYKIQGSSGNKYVAQHMTNYDSDDQRYGVILTDTDITSLTQQLLQEEAAKQLAIAKPAKLAANQVPLQVAESPQKLDKSPGYEIVISEMTLEKIKQYQAKLSSGQEQAGEYLANKLNATGKAVEDLTTTEFIEAMLSTKKPFIFAESQIKGWGKDWNNSELAILGDINVTVPVTIYDNGTWSPGAPGFSIHQKPLEGELLFTPGALLKHGKDFSGNTPDFDEVTKDGVIDQVAYNALVERRLLPLLVHANEKAEREGKPALITLPGVGAGEFAGAFKGKMGVCLNIAIKEMLQKHSSHLGNIAAIYYDSYNECDNEQIEYHNIKYRVRPQMKGNQGKTQLSDPKTYQEAGDDFSKCKLYKIVAWDHVSLPGNDYFKGLRNTDDGVAAAATSSMAGITGVEGRYDANAKKYLPPNPPYHDWSEVAEKQVVHLRVENNLKIVTGAGALVKFADYQQVVNAPSFTIPNPPENLGYKDISIIAKTTLTGLVEVLYIKDQHQKNNYLLNFSNEQDAQN